MFSHFKPGLIAATIILTVPLPASSMEKGLEEGVAVTDSVIAPSPVPESAPDSPALSSPAISSPALPSPALPSPGLSSIPAPLRGRLTAPSLPEFSYALRAPGELTAWSGGAIVGGISGTDLPGLMAIEQGNLSFIQEFGPVTLTAYGEAIKYGFFNGLRTSYGFGGSLTWQASDRLSLTLFGSYYTSPGPMSPAMAGYASIPTFGGYLDWSFSDRWGVKVGAKSYRSMMTGRWEAQPIVMPYYRINAKASVGVDVGGILYNVIKGSSGSYRRSNPTLAPDIPSINDRFP